MGTEVTSFFEGAAPSIHLRVVVATTVQEADRVFSPIPPPKRWKRGAEIIPEEGTIASAEIVYAETVYVWKTLPVMHILPFCDSQSVNRFGDSSSGYRVSEIQPTLSWETPALQSNWARIT